MNEKLLVEAREKMQRLESLSNGELLERAWTELGALCGAEGKQKKWLMSIPVDADQDSDILFGEVLKRFAKLEDERFGITVVDGVRGIDLPEGVKAYFEVTDRVFIKEKNAKSPTE